MFCDRSEDCRQICCRAAPTEFRCTDFVCPRELRKNETAGATAATCDPKVANDCETTCCVFPFAVRFTVLIGVDGRSFAYLFVG